MISAILSFLRKISLPSFLNPKVMIPAIGVIASSIFGGGMYVQNQIDRVILAKMEQKYVVEITELKSHIEDINKLLKESTQDREQQIVLLTYVQYLISVGQFYKDKNEDMLNKAEEQKKIFLDYAIKYSGEQDISKIHFITIDGINIPVKLHKLSLPKKD